jgi:YegS/Rv2252/BmrU family lipid kinase
MMKRRIALVVRPPTDEAKLEEVRSAVSALRHDGHRIAVRLTFEAGDARRYARAAARSGCDVVAAAGGDGTVNEVVNGLVASRSGTALAIVPLGTANDFAKGLGIPEDVGSALRVAAEGTARPVDIARVNRRCFINVSTGGFGAATSQSAGRGLKKHLGGLSYILNGAKKMRDFRVRSAVFRVDGDIVHAGAFVFFAAATRGRLAAVHRSHRWRARATAVSISSWCTACRGFSSFTWFRACVPARISTVLTSATTARMISRWSRTSPWS